MRRAKTSVPRAPFPLIDRAGLRARLDASVVRAEDGRVVLVSATAGYGKTVTVADWVRTRPDIASPWVTLDASDRDEDGVLRSLRTALTSVDAIPPDSPLRRAPARSTDRRAEVLHALEDLDVGIHLVLDDVHEIIGHPSFAVVRDLVRHPLPHVVLVLCSRYDPPLGLDRLRLAGRLDELRAGDLRFGPREASALLDAATLGLRDAQVETLLARTEGWPAALRLAAMSLRSAVDRDAFVEDFAGDDRSVADYLVDEVLSGLSGAEYDLLTATSVCHDVDLDTAVALTGDPTAGETLARLAASSGLLTPLDRHGRGFHIHELLRSHVSARLRRRDPARLADLHRRAAAWFEEHDAPAAALRHTTALGDDSATAALLRRRSLELLARGELVALAESLEVDHEDSAMPMSDPRLILIRALVDLETGRFDRADRLIAAAGHAPDGGDTVNLTMFRRIVLARRVAALGRPGDGAATASEIDTAAIEGTCLRTLAHATRATALASEDPAAARVEAEHVLEIADQRGWGYLGLQAEATLGIVRGLDRATGELVHGARTVLDRAVAHGWSESIWSIAGLAMLASAELRRARPEQALAAAVRAERSGAQRFSHLNLLVAALRGAAECDLGETTEGWRRLRHARLRCADEDHDQHLLAFVGLLEQQAALASGRVREAHEVARALAPRLEGSAEAALLHARVAWVGAHDPGARRHLAPVLDGRVRPAIPWVTVEADLLDAEIALHRGERAVAHRRLRSALETAERLETPRSLRALTPGCRTYLAEHVGSFGAQDEMVRRTLAVTSPPPAPIVALTERERAVLGLLPTQRSTGEIAEDLAVSVNTVKTHVRAIYAKLQVDNRRHAVSAARRLGLLDVAAELTPGG